MEVEIRAVLDDLGDPNRRQLEEAPITSWSLLLLGLTLEERDLSKFGRDLASTTANSTPILVAGLCYLLVTIPLGFVVRRMEAKAQEAVK